MDEAMRAGEGVRALAASETPALNAVAQVVGSKMAEVGEFAPLSLRYGIAQDALTALRALPVAERMAAMGMVSVTFQPTDEPYTYWREPLDG